MKHCPSKWTLKPFKKQNYRAQWKSCLLRAGNSWKQRQQWQCKSLESFESFEGLIQNDNGLNGSRRSVPQTGSVSPSATWCSHVYVDTACAVCNKISFSFECKRSPLAFAQQKCCCGDLSAQYEQKNMGSYIKIIVVVLIR